MTRPLVTVITAVYNGERFLGEALQSLFAQDYRPFESIVVDDGSTDATPEVVQAFPEVRYVRQANSGQAAARNNALALAQGEYVAFLDADDLWPPHKLSVQIGYLQANPEVAYVLGRQEIMLDGIDTPAWMTRDSVFGDLDGVPLVSAVIRTDVLRELGGFDTSYRYAEDRDLFVRVREQGRGIGVVPDIVLYRRFHGSNLTGSHRGKHPLLRSLKAKVDRSREQGEAANEALR
jgi:glycosyltransferase involved in cell wall biosynthesis